MSDQAERPSLPDVTLVAVTSVALRPTIDALRASMRQADFASVLLLSDTPPPPETSVGITWRPIEPLKSRADYSRFMLRDLAKHIHTSHALCIQWDGFVLNGQTWDPGFLKYDYIGAVWPHFHDDHNVGNGGFSLRSRQLLDACRKLPFEGTDVEDVVISRLCRPQLEAQGIRFAPDAVAHRFAHERTPPSGREFGFHGAFNLVRYVSSRDALRTFRDLEPWMLASSERLELLRWAVRRGRLKMALAILGGWLKRP